MEVKNASVAVVDEDDSTASRQIIDALLPPLFLRPARIPFNAINRVMEESQYTFVLDIPPKFQHDLKKGNVPDDRNSQRRDRDEPGGQRSIVH